MHPLALLAAVAAAAPPDDAARLAKPSPDPAVNRAAGDRLHAAGPAALLPILEAWPAGDPVAGHWLRSALDDAADAAGPDFPADAVKAFALDARRPGKARRAALAALDRARPGSAAALLPTLLEDAEFGPDAVADRVAAAERAAGPAEARRILESAYAAATQVEQVQALAKKLATTGATPDPLAKLGVLTRWSVVGPFEATPEEGLKRSFPPESDPRAAGYGPLQWMPVAADTEGKVDLIRAGISPERGSVAYARAVFVAPSAGTAELRVGCVDNVTAWVNGAVAAKQSSLYRSHFRADRHRGAATLNAGENVVLLKLTKTPAEEGGRPGAPPKWDFQARLVGPTGRAAAFSQPEGAK